MSILSRRRFLYVSAAIAAGALAATGYRISQRPPQPAHTTSSPTPTSTTTTIEPTKTTTEQTPKPTIEKKGYPLLGNYYQLPEGYFRNYVLDPKKNS